MQAMKIRALLAAVAAPLALVVVAAAPAAAHVCTAGVQIPLGESRTVNIGVTVEQSAAADVEIDVPPGLRIDRIDPKPGWKVVRTGSTVRYRGGPIPPFKCDYFPIAVTPLTRGVYGIPVVQRTADGTVVMRTGVNNAALSPVLEQIVYAGVKPPSPSNGGGTSITTVLGAALVAIAVVGAGVLGWRAWRRRDDDDADDLDARVAEFKCRTRDRSQPE